MKIDMRNLYDAAITGMECGSYSSFTITGGSWEQGWRGADEGKADAFAQVEITDRYALLGEGFDDGPPRKGYLTDAALRRGLQVLVERCPRLAGEIVAENSDAISGDALLQAAILGEVVYG